MYRQLIISSVLIHFVVANDLNPSKHGPDKGKALAGADNRSNAGMKIKSTTSYNLWHQHFWKPPKGSHHNITYIDKAENMIRLPLMTNYYEDKKSKRKTLKKSPKRTIQKIIKKNRSKIKKLYLIKMTSYPTVMPKIEFENAQEEFSPRKEETTTQSNQKKKSRKWNSKLPRYPMPFHQMQTRKSTYKRTKREDRDVFILKDFNELQFIKEKKDYNVMNAHFKTYW